MKHSTIFLAIAVFLLTLPGGLAAAESATVEMFSPEGQVKQVRQVAVRFSEQMVPFGDPRLVEPFSIDCPEKGRGRWADGRNWIYDFDRDLPAGVRCAFTLKQDVRTLAGTPVTGQQAFSFTTGGPAVVESVPYEGNEYIDENQIFLLFLDAEATEASVLSHVYCSVEGINERVGVRFAGGEAAAKILKRYASYVSRKGKDGPRVLIQCKQTFPNKAKVDLVWSKGVSTPSGIATTEDQVLPFRVRRPFTARFTCEKENANADCIPIRPFSLNFSAPVPWETARKIVLKGGGTIYKTEKESSPVAEGEEGEAAADAEETLPGGADERFVTSVAFKGPFPEKTSFTLEIPKNLKDDVGRVLENRSAFPLTVKTDAYPPLAKFAARFGIIELKGDATLPVTLRRLEPVVKTRTLNALMPDTLKTTGQKMVDGLKGKLHRLRLDREGQVIDWLFRVAAARRETPLLAGEDKVHEFGLPKPGGSRAFEVVGIALKEPGLYVVELESTALGASLLGEQKPMYVPAAALVTNLSAHFKWGRESSLVWVTTLDKAEPVKGATVTVRDCNGTALWTGTTDGRGLARIPKPLPSGKDLAVCSRQVNYGETGSALGSLGNGLFVFARTSDDMTFVHSSWDQGIEPWRFNLPQADYRGPVIGHTVFDRSLLRAGETVHMKHIVRKRTSAGFSSVGAEELPKAVLVQHEGSEQSYEFPLAWDAKGIAETTWPIPREAKLGAYRVVLLKKPSGRTKHKRGFGESELAEEWHDAREGGASGSFRVEEFRVPLMRATIQPGSSPLVNAKEAPLDLFVTYLSGGGAANAPVKLKSRLEPRRVRFDDYEEFAFANGDVKEEVTRRSGYDEEGERSTPERIHIAELKLDKSGALRTAIADLPAVATPQDLQTELEFRDPNGEVQTVSRRIPLWPSRLLVGIKPDSWVLAKDALKFHIIVLDVAGKPVGGREVAVHLFEKKSYSHRKRLIGGFYAYEHVTETKRIGQFCRGTTDSRGLLICEGPVTFSGNAVLLAAVTDDAGNRAVAHREVWVGGSGEWWFGPSDHDRIDLLPERKKYEPGETAKFQVRMPFREATALVTVEREGVMETFTRKLSGKMPVIELPVKGNYAPNVFVSALVVRGRVAGVQPTALVDLGKPAFKLGIAEISVGRKAYELKVKVTPEQEVYKIRQKANVKVQVRTASGKLPPKGSEVVIAAVDEGLLELMPNKSWDLLDAMTGRRGCEVKTSTAQMEVVGKRHYGLKALPHGGGGGKQITRELFDTLLLWQARVQLDGSGEARAIIPLNDSVTGFRIVAVATGGASLFGTGQASIRTTQDLMLYAGLPPVVREGDRFRAGFTVRNASDRSMEVEVKAALTNRERKDLEVQTLTLAPGEAQEAGWEILAPVGADALSYVVTALEKGGEAKDSMKAKQKIVEAVPVRTFQATLAQLDGTLGLGVEIPQDALSGKGGITVSLTPKIGGSMNAVRWYMRQYPYTCMEQRVSRAVALRDEALWKEMGALLPSHLDSDGLVKYFPSSQLQGSDVLTSYIISIAHEAGYEIPAPVRQKMEQGLLGFIEGRVVRYSSLPTADLSIRKLAALEALSRTGNAEARLLGSITIEPNLWPTSAVLDWTNVLLRLEDIPDQQKRLKEAEQIIRARLNFQGTTMGFSTERSDGLWWLMTSVDQNAVKGVLTFLNFEDWKQDMPRMARGALARQYKGVWVMTTANAWGVLAMEKFSQKFESVPVTGTSTASLDTKTESVRWEKTPEGETLQFPWPKGKKELSVLHQGTGKPWVTFQSRAAIPLREPFSSGYTIKKTVTPMEQKTAGKWEKGDVARVRLELEAQADMTWVVVSDPVPAGASILGTGLGRDSQLLTAGEKREGWVWPVFEERSFEAFRSYYEYVPKGKWIVEYTMRLNNGGFFHLPPTRVEALYAPEMLGELPNKTWEVAH